MKYIVEVNAKWLVSIETETVLQAEHKVLGYNGIWGALAFDRNMLKTDTFAGAVQGCEMVSMDELIRMVNDTCDAKVKAVEADLKCQDATSEVERLEKLLIEAKEAQRAAIREAAIQREHYDDMIDLLGRERR